MTWLSFTNPWMLAGLAAVGLPVLIHYLTRARPRRVAFPPFKFLMEACAGQQAVHRLRTFLLLAIRCLAVLAVVLLFTRPFLKPSGVASGDPAARRVVILLDGSLSMRAVQRGVPLFSRAKGEAADVLRALESGSEAVVIIAGAKAQPLLPALSRNIPALHEALVKAEPTFEQADIAGALALAKRMLGGAGEVYVFSDFQQSNWETAGALPGGVVCRLRPVGTEPVANVALTAAHVAPAEPVVGEPAEVVGTVFNGTARARQEVVRLELGEFTQEARLAVPPFGQAKAVFNISFPQAGSFIGAASLPPDDLREDDTRHLAVRVHKAFQLLLVSDADADDSRSGAFFVGRALSPSPQAAPGLSVVRRHSQDTDRGVLETADAFVLVSPATLAGEAVEIMVRRVNEGAPLLIFMDGPSAPSLALASFHPPFRLLRPVASETGEMLLPGPRPLFADSDATDWAAVRFRRHYQTQLLDGRFNEVLLTYSDGSAALTLTRVGKGAIVFANFPLAPDGGDLIGSPMFPAMLHEVLRAMRGGMEDRPIAPGFSWTLDAPASGEGTVTVTDPNGQPVLSQTIASGRTTRLALPPARQPGVYRVKQGDALMGAGVVNVDPRESDTRPIALEKIKSAPGTAVTVVRGEEDLLMAGGARPLWPQLAAAAAALFAVEMLLLALWRPSRAPLSSLSERIHSSPPSNGSATRPGSWEREEALR